MTISFYKPEGKYGAFSNFSKHGILIDGVWWQTIEHYFQAQKFVDQKYKEEIRNAIDPRSAAKLGQSRKFSIRSDWESIKVDIMRNAVLVKFQLHSELRELLLSTGKERIVEDSPSDYFWGIGSDGSGKNALGAILEEVRELLANEKIKGDKNDKGKESKE